MPLTSANGLITRNDTVNGTAAMTQAVRSFLRPRRSSESEDWNQHELSEFYRVESALVQAGLPVAVERGMSDEGEPWLIFCRGGTDEVIAHFAHIDDGYVIASSAFSGVRRGVNLRALVQQLVNSQVLVLSG